MQQIPIFSRIDAFGFSTIQQYCNIIAMNYSQPDWNDFIGDFIRLKAQQPQIIVQMMKRQNDYRKVKDMEQKILSEAADYERLGNILLEDRREYNKVKAHKDELMRQLTEIQEQLEEKQEQFEKQSQNNLKKIRESRTELISSQHSSTDNGSQLENDLIARTAHYSRLKADIRNQLVNRIAQRVTLKEEIEQLNRLISELKSRAGRYEQGSKITKHIASLKEKEAFLKQRRHWLFEQHKRTSSEVQKANKKQKVQHLLFEAEKRKIQEMLKQLKKIILSNQTRSAKKYKQIITKYKIQSQQDAYAYFQKQLNHLQRTSVIPYLQKIGPVTLQQFTTTMDSIIGLQGLQWQPTLDKIAEEWTHKGKNVTQMQQFQKSFEVMEQYLQQLERRQAGTDMQILSLKKNLQRKCKDIQSERNRLKGVRSN